MSSTPGKGPLPVGRKENGLKHLAVHGIIIFTNLDFCLKNGAAFLLHLRYDFVGRLRLRLRKHGAQRKARYT
jgi:hypothetical protein